MADPIIFVVGNVTNEPELRYTPSGVAVCNFSIATNHRVKQGDKFVDGAPTFYRATVWSDYAEHVASSLTKGMQVMAMGSVYTETYTDRNGEERSSLKLDVDEVGPALRFATAKVTRAQRGGGGDVGGDPAGGFGGQQGGGFSGPAQGGGFGGPPAGAPQGGPQQGGAPAGAPQGGPQQGGFGGPQQGGAPAGGQDPWSGGGGWDTPPASAPPL